MEGEIVLNIQSNKALFNLFSILLAFFTLTNVSNKVLNIIGISSILVILLISSLILIFIYLRTNRVRKNSLKTLVIYTLLMVIFGIGILSNFNMRGIVVLSQLILLLNFFFLFSKLNYDRDSIDVVIISCVLTIYLIIFYGGLAIEGINVGFYKSIYQNPNTLGITSLLFSWLSWILYKIYNKKIYMIYSLMYVFIIYMSGNRSSIMIVSLVIFNLIIFRFISKNRLRWNLYYILIITSILSITYISPLLGNYSFFTKLNLFVFELTGKNLLSGRNFIWQESIHLISQRPLLGYGTGTLLSNISNINFSAHNLYIQVAIQNGIIGLSLFLILLWGIWNALYYKKSDSIIRLSACFFVGILVQNMFEVTLTQNNVSFAIIQWFIISVGVSRVSGKFLNRTIP